MEMVKEHLTGEGSVKVRKNVKGQGAEDVWRVTRKRQGKGKGQGKKQKK